MKSSWSPLSDETHDDPADNYRGNVEGAWELAKAVKERKAAEVVAILSRHPGAIHGYYVKHSDSKRELVGSIGMVAVDSGFAAILPVLFEAGEHFDKTHHDFYPMAHAIKKGNIPVLRKLLALGVSQYSPSGEPYVVRRMSRTAFDAPSGKDSEVIALLMENGLDVHAPYPDLKVYGIGEGLSLFEYALANQRFLMVDKMASRAPLPPRYQQDSSVFWSVFLKGTGYRVSEVPESILNLGARVAQIAHAAPHARWLSNYLEHSDSTTMGARRSFDLAQRFIECAPPSAQEWSEMAGMLQSPTVARLGEAWRSMIVHGDLSSTVPSQSQARTGPRL